MGKKIILKGEQFADPAFRQTDSVFINGFVTSTNGRIQTDRQNTELVRSYCTVFCNGDNDLYPVGSHLVIEIPKGYYYRLLTLADIIHNSSSSTTVSCTDILHAESPVVIHTKDLFDIIGVAPGSRSIYNYWAVNICNGPNNNESTPINPEILKQDGLSIYWENDDTYPVDDSSDSSDSSDGE